MMTIQDERYLNYKRQIERKKIEKLKSSLHLIDAETGAQRKHTFFVDKKVEDSTRQLFCSVTIFALVL